MRYADDNTLNLQTWSGNLVIMNKVEKRFTTAFKIALFQLDVTPLFFAGPDVYQVSETSYKAPLQI